MSIFDKFLRIRELGIFSIIIIVVIAASIIDSRFLTIDSWRAVFLAIPLILVMAMGQMMVIICRHVDISIGSILAFAAITIGFVFIHYPETSLWMALLITAFVGLIMGLINGIIVTRFNVHSIIVTLGTLSLYRGLVFIVSGGRQIDRNDIPVHIISFSQTSFFFFNSCDINFFRYNSFDFTFNYASLCFGERNICHWKQSRSCSSERN